MQVQYKQKTTKLFDSRSRFTYVKLSYHVSLNWSGNKNETKDSCQIDNFIRYFLEVSIYLINRKIGRCVRAQVLENFPILIEFRILVLG